MSPPEDFIESIPLISDDEEEKSTVYEFSASLNKHHTQPRMITRVYSAIQHCGQFLTPSFLSSKTDFQFREYESNSTQWLDGLRGTAALFVFLYHFVVSYVNNATYVWDPVHHPNLLFLPIFRVTYNGSAMVRVFFVISGFALTHKPARLLRQKGRQDALMKTLASSLFRRYLRLILPCLGAFVIIHFARIFGAFDWFEHHHLLDPKDLPGNPKKNPDKSGDGLIGQATIMLSEFYQFAVVKTIFNQKYDFTTDNHMWTIPIEYKESLSLFLLVSMLSQVQRGIRMYLILPAYYIFLIYHKNFDTPAFVSGYFLAELHAGFEKLQTFPNTLPNLGSFAGNPRYRNGRKLFWSVIAFLGLFLLSFPTSDGHRSFGYVTLCKLLSGHSNYQKRVAIQTYGASILVFALLYLPRAQKWLSSPFSQYLGRISFSLYLMHGFILRTLGHRLVLEGWSHFNSNAHTERIFIVVLAFFFAVLPMTIWISDVFWRLVDAPSTRFARWFEGKLILRDSGETQS